MKAVWLREEEARLAMGMGRKKFREHYVSKLRVDVKGPYKYYEIPVYLLTDKGKETWKDLIHEVSEEDSNGLEVEEILGDVAGKNEDFGIVSQIDEARLENLKARTKSINEKLEARKELLFFEWSEKFFKIFADSFAKYKNALISLHLDKEQTDILNNSLEDALKTLEDNLSKIKIDYMTEEDANE